MKKVVDRRWLSSQCRLVNSEVTLGCVWRTEEGCNRKTRQGASRGIGNSSVLRLVKERPSDPSGVYTCKCMLLDFLDVIPI